jgi:hypothetical protein
VARLPPSSGARRHHPKVRDLEAQKKAINGEMAGLRPLPRLASQVIEDRLWIKPRARLLMGQLHLSLTVDFDTDTATPYVRLLQARLTPL